MSASVMAKSGAEWSMSALAEEYSIDRRTVAKLLEGVESCGSHRNHPTYKLKAATIPIVKYIVGAQSTTGAATVDPNTLPPKDRKDWYDSELKRIQHDKVTGELIPAELIANADAAKNKKIALSLDTMADVLERDVDLTSEQVQAVNRIIDSIRNDLYSGLMEE